MKKKSTVSDKSTSPKPRNLIPGTLIYRGRIKQGFSIDVNYYNEDNLTQKDFDSALSFEAFDSSYPSAESETRWINVTGLWNVPEIKEIGNYLGISKLILEQILNISNHSINRAGDGYLFNCLQMVYSEGNKINNEYISIYKGSDFVVTFQEKPGDIFDDIRRRIVNNEGFVRKKALNYLYFCLLDALGDNYLLVAEELKPQIEEIEELIIKGDRIKIQLIHEIRKTLMILGFNSIPVGRFIRKLVTDKSLLPISEPVYLESLDINMKKAVNDIELLNNTVDHLFENYVLNNSNNMNQIMTILTIFSAIFIPLSFLAGVFGMNFAYLPGLENRMGFFYFLIGCVVTAGGMLIFFKVKKWF